MTKTTHKAKYWVNPFPSLPVVLMMAVIAVGVAGCAHLNGMRSEPITIPQIIQMAKEGMSADDIISRLQASGTVYRLKASRLATLEKKGVPAKVIDYMQQTYLDAVNKDARYQEWQDWHMEDEYGWYGGAPYDWPDFEVHPDDE
ncbi:MAG: hypothetical protein P8010_24230 [Desulfosarcinaceae bacterium]|jgi:hypothetical protein